MKIDGVNAPPREVVQGLPATSAPRPTLVSSARPQVRNCQTLLAKSNQKSHPN